MRISIVSFSCCNPAMRSEDQAYLAKVQEALAQSNIKAQVSIVPMTEAVSSLGTEKVRGLWPLWEKYGAAMMPAMFIDDELELYGGVPTKERIIKAIAKHGGTDEQARVELDDDVRPKNERGV